MKSTSSSRAGSWITEQPVKQLAIVVRDLEDACEQYSQLLAVNGWTGYELTSSVLRGMRYRGESAQFSFRHALAWKADVQLELVQPLDGPSIFQDHLDKHGPGLHHVGIYVDDHKGACDRMVEAGFQELQAARGFGATGDGAFAYFDLMHPLGAIIELIEAPSVRREPLFVHEGA